MAYPDDGKPIRLRCQEAIKAALEGIRRSSGYYTDVERVEILQSDLIVKGVQMPFVVIVDDGLDERVEENACQETREMPLAVYLALRVMGGATWVEQIAWFVSDVRKAIDADSQLGGVALYTDTVGVSVFEAPVDGVASAVVKLAVTYRNAIGDPASISPA